MADAVAELGGCGAVCCGDIGEVDFIVFGVD
jgi:hypothetical protein